MKTYRHDTWTPMEREALGDQLTEDCDCIKIPEIRGTWYVIDKSTSWGPAMFLLESESAGDEWPHCIVDEYGYVVLAESYNGWNDIEELVANGELLFKQDENSGKWSIFKNIRA